MQNISIFLFLVFIALTMASYEEFKSYYQDDSITLSKYPTQEAFNALIVNGKDFRYMDSSVEDYDNHNL